MKNVYLSLVTLAFIGCGGGGGSLGNDTELQTKPSISLTVSNETGIYKCDNKSIENFTVVSSDSSITFNNCIIDNLIWTGKNSHFIIDNNSTIIKSILFSGKNSTLEAEQSVLDLVDSFYLTEIQLFK